MHIDQMFEKIKAAIKEKNLVMLNEAAQDFTSLARKNILEYGDENREVLQLMYTHMSKILILFFKTGKSEWPEADRIMGGLEAIKGFIGDVIYAASSVNLIEKYKEKEDVVVDVLRLLLKAERGLVAKDAANELAKESYIIANIFRDMEREGIVFAILEGEKSIAELTDKGRRVASAFA